MDSEALRQARLKAGLSLAQVAGPDLTRQAVHLIETGKVRPTMRSLRVIARRLGVSISSLLVQIDPMSSWTDGRALALERLCAQQQFTNVLQLGAELLDGAASPEIQALAHLHMGRAFYHLARPGDALEHLLRARELFESQSDPWLAAEAMDWEAGALFLKEDPTAQEVMEEALRRYRALQPRRPQTEARMLEHLASILLRHRLYSAARELYEEALHVAGSVLDLHRLGNIYHGLSRCHSNLGDSARSVDLGSKAVVLLTVENELRPAPFRTSLPRAENDLALLLMREPGQLGHAEELLLSALGRLSEASTERLKSYVLRSLAELRQRQGRVEEALDLVKQSVDLAERLEERMSLASGYQQMGEVQAQLGAQDLADRNFRRALQILTELGLGERKGECLAAYRKVLEARGEIDRTQSLGA